MSGGHFIRPWLFRRKASPAVSTKRKKGDEVPLFFFSHEKGRARKGGPNEVSGGHFIRPWLFCRKASPAEKIRIQKNADFYLYNSILANDALCITLNNSSIGSHFSYLIFSSPHSANRITSMNITDIKINPKALTAFPFRAFSCLFSLHFLTMPRNWGIIFSNKLLF